MSFDEKTLEDMYKELDRVKSERDAKGSSHLENAKAQALIRSIQRAIDKRQSELK